MRTCTIAFCVAIALGAGAVAQADIVERNGTPGPDGSPNPAVCAPYLDHVGYLANRYGEHPIFTGQVANGMVVQIFANGKSGSWTMVLVRTDGIACVQGTGEAAQREVGI